MYIILTQIVDKLSDKNKNTLLKKIIVDYNESNGNMTSPYLVLLFEYFEPLFLYKYRDLELGKGDKLNDILIGYYYTSIHQLFFCNKIKKHNFPSSPRII